MPGGLTAGSGWLFDLASHFRLPYFAILLISALAGVVVMLNIQ